MKKLLLLLILCFLLPASGVTIAEINQALGLPLLGANRSEWTLPALQTRMKKKFNGSNGRFSLEHHSPVAGAAPEEIIVYTTGKNQQILRITIIYANKGDTTGRYSAMIRDAKRSISDTLTPILGKNKRNTFYSGNLRVKADMWQSRWGNFFLEVNKKEFTMLHLIPPGGNSKPQTPDRKKDYSANIKRNKFGDVFIPNVPMVDQGSKGYCVPATMERVFLYYGIAVDMHHLADIGNTDRNDGTYTDEILRDVTRIRRRAGLSFTRLSGLSISSVSRYIDKGYPVFWIMYSTEELNKVYAFSTANRKNAASPEAWKRALKKVSIPADDEGPHMCLIVGYNRKTDEIAVTNSWGDRHIIPIWIPLKVAKKVSRELLVFTP